MRKVFLVFALICLCSQVSAQQTVSNDMLEEFTKVSLSGNLSVELIEAENNKVDIELIDSDVSRLRWDVKDGELSVALRSFVTNNKGSANVKIYYSGKLTELKISDANVLAQNLLEADLFDIKVSSGALLNAEIKCLDLSISASGNSIAQVKGEAKYVSATASDKSRLELPSLEAVAVVATANTAAEIYVNAQERLEATSRTGSTIFYRGSPTILRALTSKILKFGATVHDVGE